MARTITYWYDVIIAEKNTFSNLNTLQPNVDSGQQLLTDVTSTSRVARWRLWVWCVAVAAYALDVLFDLFKIELEAISLRSRFGTLPWYVFTAKNFQYGNILGLQWINNQYQYAPPPATQYPTIIACAAAVEFGNTVILKVAQFDGTNVLKLTAPQLAVFTDYMCDATKVKPAGVILNIISDDPDQLQLYVKIKYNRLILDATGQLLSTPGVYPVNDAINQFIMYLSKPATFNGVLELCNLVDSLQATTGVDAAYITNALARYGANPFVAFAERYQANAGYLIIDPGTPLIGTVTYE